MLIGVPFRDIAEAKLTLTDQLIEAARQRLPQKGYGDGAQAVMLLRAVRVALENAGFSIVAEVLS